MVIDNVFGLNRTRQEEAATPRLVVRVFTDITRQFARVWCGLHGHLIMLHYEPNKLSLQCSFCGYATEGWDVGKPLTARRQANNLQARPDRRRTLRPLPSNARLAS